MTNAADNLEIDALGSGGVCAFDLPVDGGSHLRQGTLVSQLTATGALVPYSTASSGVCVGVVQHEADNTDGSDGDVRAKVESRRMYAFANDGSDSFSEASLIGSVAYGSDDHTVADASTGGRKPVGFFYGMEDDGQVRVFVDPAMASIVLALQSLTDTPASADALRDNIVASFG